MTSDASVRETVHTRLFDATRERVFDAWTTPELLAKWWGPNGFANTFHIFEPKPGGRWIFTMHGPNGVDYPNESVFLEVRRPDRIVLRHAAPLFDIIADFHEVQGKTRLTFCQRFETEREMERKRQLVTQANEENLDRLASVLNDRTGEIRVSQP